MQAQVTVKQLVDRRTRAWVAPLTDLREKLDADRIRPPLSVRSCRDDFLEVMPTTADRVRTSIDTHPQGRRWAASRRHREHGDDGL